MSIIDEIADVCDKYDELIKMLTKRAKIKSECSYRPDSEWLNNIIQDGKLEDLSCYSESIYMYFNYDGGDTCIDLDLAELEMSHEDFKNHMERKFSDILEQRKLAKQKYKDETEKRERETLAHLQKKYGTA